MEFQSSRNESSAFSANASDSHPVQRNSFTPTAFFHLILLRTCRRVKVVENGGGAGSIMLWGPARDVPGQVVQLRLRPERRRGPEADRAQPPVQVGRLPVSSTPRGRTSGT